MFIRYPPEIGFANEKMAFRRVDGATGLDVGLKFIGQEEGQLVLVVEARCSFNNECSPPFGGGDGAHDEVLSFELRAL